MDKLPPIEKVYEAWSAVADGRVTLLPEEGKALVGSSDGAKTYTVSYGTEAEPGVYASNDNSTYWRLYAGYPVLAVLMEQGRLPLDRAEAEQWRGVNWTALNAAAKRDYARAVAEVEQARGIDAARAREKAEEVMEALRRLPIAVKRGNMKAIIINK